MVGLPEETDRGIERLGELIARHRPFRQACEDRVTKGHCANPPYSSRQLDFMHEGAYASICISTVGTEPCAPPLAQASRPEVPALCPQETSDDHDRPRQMVRLHEGPRHC